MVNKDKDEYDIFLYAFTLAIVLKLRIKMLSVAQDQRCFCELFLLYELSVFIVMLQSASKCRNVFMIYVLF